MSHLQERKEKVCLNCNASIYGKFCHICGQENIEPKESFWSLSTHFFYDIIHFDGKFFSTLKYLLFKPGYLPAEHLRGRRADYLHPIRLYVFVSAFFFLVMFSFYGEKEQTIAEKKEKKIKKLEQRKIEIEDIYKKNISAQKICLADSFLNVVNNDIAIIKKDSNYHSSILQSSDKLDLYKLDSSIDNEFTSTRNIQISTNGSNSKIGNYFKKKKEKYSSTQEFKEKMLDSFFHSIPKALFFALPLYALMLLTVYSRDKEYYYANHVIFSIHLFSFTFILILFAMWLNSLLLLINIDAHELINGVATIIAAIYTYKALKYFYKQKTGKTIAKFIILSLGCIVASTIVTILAFMLSMFAL